MSANAPHKDIELPISAGMLQKRLMSVRPDCNFARWAVRMQPAGAVSGDVVLSWLGEHDQQLLCFIGDVVGHGSKAAFIGVITTAYLLRQRNKLPHQRLEDLNRFLTTPDDDRMYCTGLLLSLSDKGVLSAASAGHPAALILHAQGRVSTFPSGHSAPLGLFDAYLGPDTETLQLQPHDRILLLTDGLLERPGDGTATKMLPDEVRSNILSAACTGSLQSDTDMIWALLRGLNSPHQAIPDDQTMMLIEYQGPR